MQKNETQSSLNNQGFKVSNIDTSTSFFSEFYNEIQDYIYLTIIFLLGTISILIMRFRNISNCVKNRILNSRQVNYAGSNDQFNNRNMPIKVEQKADELFVKKVTADDSEFRTFNVVASAPIFDLENEVKNNSL